MSLKRYPCVGGPLDGLMLTTNDLTEEYRHWKTKDVIRSAGQFAHHRRDYVDFNRADSRANVPSMIRLYKELLP